MKEVDIKNYLNNKLIKGYTWHLVGTFSNQEFNLYAYSIGDGLKSLLDNMDIEYKPGIDRIYIRTKDVLAYIKSKDREDKINSILNDMKDDCKIPHMKDRFLRKPKESFEHKFGVEFYKRVFRSTGEYIDGKPIQKIITNTYRTCEKCDLLEVHSHWDGWHVSLNQRADIEWRENGLN